MMKIKNHIQRIIMMPVVSIIGASLFPLRIWAQQALIMFTLIWYGVFIISDFPLI